MDTGLIIILGTYFTATGKLLPRWNAPILSGRGSNLNFVRYRYPLKPYAFKSLRQQLAGYLLTRESIVGVRLVLLPLVLNSKFMGFLVLCECIQFQVLYSLSWASLWLDISSPLWPLLCVILNVIRITLNASSRWMIWLRGHSTGQSRRVFKLRRLKCLIVICKVCKYVWILLLLFFLSEIDW